jgi:hypothetical protein
MKKPRKPSSEPAQWSVLIMRAKLTWLGSVEARDEAEAMDKAMRQLDIRGRSPADQRQAGLGARERAFTVKRGRLLRGRTPPRRCFDACRTRAARRRLLPPELRTRADRVAGRREPKVRRASRDGREQRAPACTALPRV